MYTGSDRNNDWYTNLSHFNVYPVALLMNKEKKTFFFYFSETCVPEIKASKLKYTSV